MHFNNLVKALLLACCCFDNTSGRQLFQRDTSESSSIVLTTSAPSSSSAAPSDVTPSSSLSTPQSSATPASTSSIASSLIATHTQPASAGGNGSATSVASQTTSIVPTASAQNETAIDVLPLTPKITPAIGIAGVVLLLSGVSLGLVGVKHRWLQCFFSTALLFGLGVTLLIVYVMNPPVTNAIQGAYLAAVFVTGAVFGGVAIIFNEVTEGFGCLLGGYCLATWFLVLSPGGLIQTKGGRAIMIAAFCVACFSLSFSRFTRTYGLIACTSFAGATATVLGIDCFSRAGLKEFWIYLWDVNQNEFPLNTNTYPLTRGIRVEIASIVILFMLGVMSQVKIWKIVKERRAKKEAERMRDEEDRAQVETAVGLNVTANIDRERQAWEAVYGDKDRTRVHVDSAVGSSIESFPQRGGSVREEEVGDIELADLHAPTSRRESRKTLAPITVQVASDEHAPRHPGHSAEDLLGHHNVSAANSSKHPDSQRTSADGKDATSIKDWSAISSSAAAGPAVTPLPFTVPSPDEENGDDAEDRSSVRSRATSGQMLGDGRSVPVKLSLRERLEADRIPSIEDDRASSVAATAHEDVDMDGVAGSRLSVAPSLNLLHFDGNALAPAVGDNRRLSRNLRHSMIEVPFEEDDEEAIARPKTASEQPNAEPKGETAHSSQLRPSTLGSHRQSRSSQQPSHADREEGAERVSQVDSLGEHLPPALSKVAQTYRTNEWAKHIADADMPEEDMDDAKSISPGVKVDVAFAEESAKPVDVSALQPIPSTATRPELGRQTSHNSTGNPYRQSYQSSNGGLTRAGSGATTPVYAFSRSGSTMSASRPTSAVPSKGQQRLSTQGIRSVSAPLARQTLVESPVEEVATGSRYGHDAGVGMTSKTNLMDERNLRMKQKPISTSFNALAVPSPTSPNGLGPSDSASVRNIAVEQADGNLIPFSERLALLSEEDMTLAQRKASLRQHRESREPLSPPTPQSPPSRGTWTRMPSVTATNNNLIYDSHQPKRSNTVDTVKQANMMTSWRQSLAQEAAAATHPLFRTESEQLQQQHHQVQMMSAVRQAEQEQLRRQQAARVHRESAMDLAMRSGMMNGAHRDAIRKMQAKVQDGNSNK